MSKSRELEERILLLVPLGEDETVTTQILTGAGLFWMICGSLAELLDQTALGAGVILLAGEALTPATGQTLTAALQRQPAWSNLPIVMLVKSQKQTRRQAALIQRLSSKTHMTLLEYPIPVPTLVTVVRSGLGASKPPSKSVSVVR